MLELDPLVGKAHISLWGVNAAAAGNGGGVPIIAEREETGIVVDTVTLCHGLEQQYRHSSLYE